MPKAYGSSKELGTCTDAERGDLSVANGGAILTITAFLYIGLVKHGHFGEEDKQLLVKSSKRHFELFWIVTSKLIICAKEFEGCIPGFTADKHAAMSSTVDAHLKAVKTPGQAATSARFLVGPAAGAGDAVPAAAALEGVDVGMGAFS